MKIKTRYHITPVLEWLLPKRQKVTSVDQDVEKENTCMLLVGILISRVFMENSLKGSASKICRQNY
jgi:hypothetical protein